ncbi:MAG: SpoIIE family protein phosphatase [Rhodobacteraceae bacterium]|nr:SpoIIE family protein phosphatase [Paracoccaceae bacterium]
MRRRVLVADDSRVQRRILLASLRRWGYAVDEAADGTEALALITSRPYDFVLSDWMMPGLTGLDLCRRFRAMPREGYGYFILLTAKAEKEEVARGLEVGADDFLAKPVSAAELHARMLAGERILNIERELSEKNRLLNATLTEMRGLYAALDRDLVEARKLQMTLVRERSRDFGTAEIAILLRPSGHVGGDLVGYIPLTARRLALFSIDVSGHGVASAMLAARLAGMLSSATAAGSIAWAPTSWRGAKAWPPETVASRLNRMILHEIGLDQYLTCVYADADLVTGRVALVQAGHPHPLLIRAGGGIERLGNGGLPVGLLPGARYERIDLRMRPGDRLLLMSDGLTEAADRDGTELGEEGVRRSLARHAGLSGTALLEALLRDADEHARGGEDRDDISAVLFAYRGPPAGSRRASGQE